MIRSGRGAEYFPIRPPYVPGNGVGGTIAALGAGVDSGWLGRPVVAHTGGAGGTGGYAELAAVDLTDCARSPTTSTSSSDRRRPRRHDCAPHPREDRTEGRGVELILGAAGGMGLLLVQLLAGRGAKVVVPPAVQRNERSLQRPGPWRQSTTAIPVGPMRCSTPVAGVADRRARRGRRNDRRRSVPTDRRRRALLGDGTPSGSFARSTALR